MSKDYLEIAIKINSAGDPDCIELVSDILFSCFDCEGVVTGVETYEDSKLVSSDNDTVKGYAADRGLSFDEILNIINSQKRFLIANGVSENTLGSWETSVTTVEQEDWSKKWKENWRPVKAGKKVVICPSWIDYEREGDEVVISLDPGGAFGTGTHATTKLCILAIEKYLKPGMTMADIGTGSGILAITAAKLGAFAVTGTDNDPVAIEVACENAQINDVSQMCTFVAQEKIDLPQKFDFVAANILHNVLAEIMGSLKNIMKEKSKIVLSGILDAKRDLVLDAVKKNGLKVVETTDMDGWTAITAEL